MVAADNDKGRQLPYFGAAPGRVKFRARARVQPAGAGVEVILA
ncbi:hypothetical protein [Kribbella sp. NPDC048928]